VQVLSLFFQMLLAMFYIVGKVSQPIIGENALSHFPEWIHGRITKCVSCAGTDAFHEYLFLNHIQAPFRSFYQNKRS
jgi:hypothetical protein